MGAFPPGGDETYRGHTQNICNAPVANQASWEEYSPRLVERALPFLREFSPELVIVCAGYDALATDELATVNLVPRDYFRIAELIKSQFGAVALGLEGGYNVDDLPLAFEQTMSAFTSK